MHNFTFSWDKMTQLNFVQLHDNLEVQRFQSFILAEHVQFWRTIETVHQVSVSIFPYQCRMPFMVKHLTCTKYTWFISRYWGFCNFQSGSPANTWIIKLNMPCPLPSRSLWIHQKLQNSYSWDSTTTQKKKKCYKNVTYFASNLNAVFNVQFLLCTLLHFILGSTLPLIQVTYYLFL